MTDAELLNHVANQPEVLRAITPGLTRLDLSSYFDRPHTYLFGDTGGVVLYVTRGHRTWDVHFLLTDALRGKNAMQRIKDSLETMFTRHGAYAIYGSTPRDNRACRAMGRALGARPIGVSIDYFGRASLDYVLERDKWVTSLEA